MVTARLVLHKMQKTAWNGFAAVSEQFEIKYGSGDIEEPVK